MPVIHFKPKAPATKRRKKKQVTKAASEYDETVQRIAAERAILNVDFSGITRLKGNVANGDRSDPVVYDAPTELAMRRMMAHFGFPRLPLTWAELHSVYSYCEYLWALAGGGVPGQLLEAWRESAREVELEYMAWRVPIFDAYVAGDTESLRRIHREQGTMEKLAADWRECENDDCQGNASQAQEPSGDAQRARPLARQRSGTSELRVGPTATVISLAERQEKRKGGSNGGNHN